MGIILNVFVIPGRPQILLHASIILCFASFLLAYIKCACSQLRMRNIIISRRARMHYRQIFVRKSENDFQQPFK